MGYRPRTQTFEKGDLNFRYFKLELCESYSNSDIRPVRWGWGCPSYVSVAGQMISCNFSAEIEFTSLHLPVKCIAMTGIVTL